MAPLVDSKKKSEKQKICGFYESLELQHLRPKAYKQCVKLPYDLYCPSTKVDDAEYVCAHRKKICTTKELLKFHLRSTQHHSFEPEPDVENLESENNDCDVDGLPDIVDGPCLIPCMEKFFESTWDITYE